ncbi:MAG: hypothetical protein DI566_03150 [Microbacterium sp.]|nr:MAG: hypothetical protein DI566_03150 [Microbacterium sp.]
MRARVRKSGDAGFSLVELMVALGVFGLLMTLVVSLVISTVRGLNDQRAGMENSRVASTSMNELTRVIRAGTEIPVYGVADNDPVFVYAGAERLVLNAFIDAGTAADPPPVRVEFARNAANELVETRWYAYHVHTTYWAFNATSAFSRTVARSLLPVDAAVPVFTYWDKNESQLVPPAGGTLTTAQIRNVASVKVTLRVQTDGSGRVAPVMIQNEVGMPNLGIARVEVD